MSVAWVVSANVAPGGTTTPFTFGITVSGTNPVLMVGIGLASDTATITAVTWSLGSGTPFEVKNIRAGTAYASVWAIPAPTAGAGTISVSVSEAAIYHQAAASVFSGADQTSSVSSTGDADAESFTPLGTGGVTRYLTVTPLNLTANDCSFGVSVNTLAGDELGFATNDRYKNSTTAVNLAIGDSSGTTDLIASLLDATVFNWVAIGVRVVVAGGAPPPNKFFILTHPA